MLSVMVANPALLGSSGKAFKGLSMNSGNTTDTKKPASFPTPAFRGLRCAP